MFTAGLGEVASRGDAELQGKRLQEHRHQTAEQDDTQERVAEFRAPAKVGRPVAGVHVADGDQVAGARKGEQLAEERCSRHYRDGAVDFRERSGPQRGR